MLSTEFQRLVDTVPSIIAVIENLFRVYWIPGQLDSKTEVVFMASLLTEFISQTSMEFRALGPVSM